MRSMKKNVGLLLLVLSLVLTMVTFASCRRATEEPAHEHSYTTEVVAPTCTVDGYTKHTCSCGDYYTDTKVAVAHKMTEVAGKAPTCAAAGYTGYSVCSVCGYTDGISTPIAPSEHAYTVSYEYPTLTTAGSRNYVCADCNHTKSEPIEALSASLPVISEMLADMFGGVKVALELDEDTQMVYVTELSSYDSQDGLKQVIFFDLAELVIDGKGADFKAHFKLQAGYAQAAVTGLVPVEDIVIDPAEAEMVDIYFYINGETVAIEVDGDETQSVKLSETIYTAMAQMLGMSDYEELAEVMYLRQEIAKLMPLIEKALTSEMPTVSPEYSQHLADLFALIGEDLVTATTKANGDVVYTVKLSAFKQLFEDVEDMTLAEYFESVYGEDVVGAMASFLTNLPDKTVKEIVNAAVEFADGTGVAISDIYQVIDLYIYFATGEEFSIEDQIVERYNVTLVELLAEISGIEDEEKAEFIESTKDSFADVAETLQTISLDEILSGMFIGDDEGFMDAFRSAMEALDDVVELEITVDAEGNLIELDADIAEAQFDYKNDGESIFLNAVTASGVTLTVAINDSEISVVVTDRYGEPKMTGNMTVTEEVVDGDTIITVEADLCDDENDLLDYKVVYVNAVLTEAEVVIRGYDTTEMKGYDSETDEWYSVIESEFETFLTIQYNDTEADGRVLVLHSDDVTITITAKDNFVEVVVDDAGEILFEGVATWTDTEDVDSLVIVAKDANETVFEGTITATALEDGASLAVVVKKDGETIVDAIVTVTDTEDSDSLAVVVKNDAETLFEGSVTTTGTDAGNSLAVVLKALGETILDGAVTVSEATDGDSQVYTLAIDLNKLLSESTMEGEFEPARDSYYEFDGAIKLTIS